MSIVTTFLVRTCLLLFTSILTVVLCCPVTASFLKKSTVLTELRLACCGIDAERASQLAEALSGIKILDLSVNTVGSQGAEHLGKLSGGVWGYGLTYIIRRCQYATPNRETSGIDRTMLLLDTVDLSSLCASSTPGLF